MIDATCAAIQTGLEYFATPGWNAAILIALLVLIVVGGWAIHADDRDREADKRHRREQRRRRQIAASTRNLH